MYSTVPRCGLRLLAIIAFYYRTRIDGVCLSSPARGSRHVRFLSIPYLSLFLIALSLSSDGQWFSMAWEPHPSCGGILSLPWQLGDASENHDAHN